MRQPKSKCVGYFPKETMKAASLNPEWSGIEAAKEVASVSNCISEGPEGWIDHWKHNDMGFFDSESAALGVITDKDKAFDLYAYKIYPVRFDNGRIDAYEPPIDIDCDLAGYVLLGFDIVSRSKSSFFECSALSCNYAAKDFDVNQYCLIDRFDDALQAAISISEGQYEPGPYYLFEVHRRAG